MIGWHFYLYQRSPKVLSPLVSSIDGYFVIWNSQRDLASQEN